MMLQPSPFLCVSKVFALALCFLRASAPPWWILKSVPRKTLCSGGNLRYNIIHDPSAACPDGRAVASHPISLWNRFVRAVVRQRRDARRDRMEGRVPLRGGGVQGVTRRFFGRPGKALPQGS